MVQFGPARYFLVGAERGDYSGLPVSGQITDTFGTHPQWRIDLGLGPHSGVDIAASSGDEIRAPAAGVVATNAKHADLGNYLTLRHDDDSYTGYAHMVEPSPLLVGASVERGQVIGRIGKTGTATGPHLHWMHTLPGNSTLNRGLGFVDPLLSVAAEVGDAILNEGAAPGAVQPAIETYVVQPGDTLFDLARRWGCSIADITMPNDIKNPNLIFVGQRLQKPQLS